MAKRIVLLLLCLGVVMGAGGCYIEPAPFGFYTYPYGSFRVYPRPYRYYYPHRQPYYRYHYHG